MKKDFKGDEVIISGRKLTLTASHAKYDPACDGDISINACLEMLYGAPTKTDKTTHLLKALSSQDNQ